MNDSSKFWKHLKKVIPGKSTSDSKITLIIIDRNLNTEIEESKTADYINDYFTSIGYNLSKDLKEPWSYTGTRAENQLLDIETNLDEITKYCKEIDIHKASSVPELSSRILKEAFLCKTEHLKYIFDQIIETGVFPTDWKCATIIPLKKVPNTNLGAVP